MTRRFHPSLFQLGAVVALVACLAIGSGCGGGRPTSTAANPESMTGSSAGEVPTSPSVSGAVSQSDVDERSLIDAVMHLVKTAATNPGGDNFNIARDHLNEIFSGAKPEKFAMSESARKYLTDRFGANAEAGIRDLENTTFTFRDSRHIEDCLLLNTVATRVAGNGDDLTRVTRLFNWLVRQVQLVPAGSLAPPDMPQAQARPYDVLLRGMATEQGAWAERSWAFIALCRQLGLDAGLLLYTPAASAKENEPNATSGEGAGGDSQAKSESQPSVWLCAVLIDGVPYLFDCGLGLAIPGPNGEGVATLEQALSNPAILDQLELPGHLVDVRYEDLTAGRLRVWIDSTLGGLTTRMRELQVKLAGRNRMILYRDPSEVHEAFAAALGDRFGGSDLWPLPMEVEYLLFNDPNFVTSTQYALALFAAELPLLPARMGQLTGELDAAIQSYVGFRFAENPVQNDGRTPIARPVQDLLDLYATYYLALGKLDQGQPEQAERFFLQTLRMAPEPSRQQPYVAMFRWGAHTNLGRLNERDDPVEAIRHYSAGQPTEQDHGNRLRARALIWESPFVPDVPSGGAPKPNVVTAARDQASR